jgi:hypothetical protein
LKEGLLFGCRGLWRRSCELEILLHYQLWCGWFSTALATAMTYREERAAGLYDIAAAERPPMVSSSSGEGDHTSKVPVWTSHPVLQEVFKQLLNHWKKNPKQKSMQVLPPKTVEVIVKAALESFADSASSLRTNEALGDYSGVKELSIPVIRTLHPPLPSQEPSNRDDLLAFQLAIRHDYYDGICKIAFDHETKDDTNHFRLETLLQSTSQCQSIDYETGCTFGQFVLQWHADRELYGHTIMFGRLCPNADLLNIFAREEGMRRHQWIESVYKGDYDGAASALISRTEKTHQATLSETKWALCMAKLSNQVVLKECPSKEAHAKLRDRKIDNKLELVGVQKELLEEGISGLSKSQSEQHLWSAHRLLDLAMDKVDRATASGNKSRRENATRYCYLALLICITYDDLESQRRHAARVWAKSITVDWDNNLWTDWIQNENDLGSPELAETVLDKTVFGGLLKDCAEEDALGPVTFSSETMEREILEHLGLVGSTESLRRLLFNVATYYRASSAREEMQEDDTDVIMA